MKMMAKLEKPEDGGQVSEYYSTIARFHTQHDSGGNR